jgi:PST family polysaccharide transporter
MSRLDSLKENILKNKILVENFTFLSVLQVSNLVLFLITVPFLFRVLESQNYGLIVFAQTIAIYFNILINFGYNLTATRDISVNRDSVEKVSEIVSSVLVIKVFFFLISFFLMVLMVFLIKGLKDHWELFLITMLTCLSDALFPVWYFQGIQKMKYITFINVTARIIATILVFIVIAAPDDYTYYPLLMGAGSLVGACMALLVVFAKHKIIFRFYKFGIIRSYFSNNVLYFLSNVSTQIYGNANKIIIGAFIGMADLAFYDIADKILYIVRVPFSLLGQTIFPKVSHDKNIRFLRKIVLLALASATIVIICLFLFSDFIITYFSGTHNPGAALVLKIIAFSLLPMIISLFYGDILLISFNRKLEYLKSRFFGLVFYFSVISVLYLAGYLNLVSMSVIVVLLEILIASLSYSYFKSKKAYEL